MQIDIYSDTICPWCMIGKARFAAAIEARAGLDAETRWRTFQLNPEMELGGAAWDDHLKMKFGSVSQGTRVYDRIAEAGRDAGIDFRFERIARIPNTLDSHRLARLAHEHGLQEAVLDALFEAYFSDGADIGEADTLAGVGRAIGLPAAEISAMFATDAYLDDVWAEDRRARRLGLEGVPTFLFEGRFAIAGAQDEEVFATMFDLGVAEAVRA